MRLRPNLAFERTRRQRASFGAVALLLLCHLVTRPRRAAQRGRWGAEMYVVDTNIINWLVDGRLTLEDLPSDGEFLATHIQRDELAKTPDEQRRAQLLAKFEKTVDHEVPTESMVVGISRVGLAKLSDGKRYYSLRDGLAALNKGRLNNSHDALIAEVAIESGWTLITADRHLARVAADHGSKVWQIAP
jgi:predicted nucleic acid-binding protein